MRCGLYVGDEKGSLNAGDNRCAEERRDRWRGELRLYIRRKKGVVVILHEF